MMMKDNEWMSSIAMSYGPEQQHSLCEFQFVRTYRNYFQKKE